MERVEITPEILKRMRAEKDRTNVSGHKLLSGRDDVPEGLNGHKIQSWLGAHTKIAMKEELVYVFQLWEKLPTRCIVNITVGTLEKMRAQKERTDVGERKLLSGRDDVPESLNFKKIQHWFAGKAKTATQEELDYVLGIWEELPTCPRVVLKPEILEEIKFHQERTGKKAAAALRGRRLEAPKGLTGSLVNEWLKITKTARKDYLDYMIELYRSLPDAKA